jgi:hypothetical protein
MNKKIAPLFAFTVVAIFAAILLVLLFWQRGNFDEENFLSPANYTKVKKNTSGNTKCTMEAKVCPNGSSVERSGPNCEFAPCPEERIQKIGGNCEYDTIAGTCKINDVSPDKTIKFIYIPDDVASVQNSRFSDMLKREQSEAIYILNPDANASYKTGETVKCKAETITSGTCTPVIFRFL